MVNGTYYLYNLKQFFVSIWYPTWYICETLLLFPLWLFILIFFLYSLITLQSEMHVILIITHLKKNPGLYLIYCGMFNALQKLLMIVLLIITLIKLH